MPRSRNQSTLPATLPPGGPLAACVPPVFPTARLHCPLTLMARQRTVFFVSDRTGITAETLGNTLLTQFEEVEFRKVTLPFVNTAERAQQALAQIDAAADGEQRPLVFSTTANDDIRATLRGCRGLL